MRFTFPRNNRLLVVLDVFLGGAVCSACEEFVGADLAIAIGVAEIFVSAHPVARVGKGRERLARQQKFSPKPDHICDAYLRARVGDAQIWSK